MIKSWRSIALVALFTSGCSLAIGFKDECVRDEDCAARGSGLRCTMNLCVQAEPIMQMEKDAGLDCGVWEPTSNTCFACVAETPPQILNACSNAECVPFDDSRRLRNVGPDGSLPPVPETPDAGFEGDAG